MSDNQDLVALRTENQRLHDRVALLEKHLEDAVRVAYHAMGDANALNDDPDLNWDRDAELEVFRAALNEAKS